MYKLLQDGDDLNSLLENTKNNSPCIISTGEDILHISQYLIVVEKGVLCSITSFSKALLCLFMCYYIFDMAYPKEIANTLLFLENDLLNLPNLQKLSASSVAAISAMDNL